MTIPEAIQNGFLNLNETQTDTVLDALFDIDDPQTRLDHGVDLLRTFIPEDKILHVLDLVNLVLDANDEMDTGADDDHDHHGHGHHHGHDHN